MAKDVIEDMYRTGKSPRQIIQEKGLVQITDEAALKKAIEEVLAANPGQLEQYREGREKLFGFFVGQVMKATRGKANPALVNELLKEMLAPSS
jgi:aspartyl-tRNA(Asn)/glutamyl-tRNA(Gln) amidotransferase subunit B